MMTSISSRGNYKIRVGKQTSRMTLIPIVSIYSYSALLGGRKKSGHTQ